MIIIMKKWKVTETNIFSNHRILENLGPGPWNHLIEETGMRKTLENHIKGTNENLANELIKWIEETYWNKWNWIKLKWNWKWKLSIFQLHYSSDSGKSYLKLCNFSFIERDIVMKVYRSPQPRNLIENWIWFLFLKIHFEFEVHPNWRFFFF